MKETIRKFVENGHDTGLMLLDMPTGSGKTYSVLEYIVEESLKPENKDKKYFFITTLKKNLPIQDLFDRFSERHRINEFNRKFLFIDSNVDTVIERLEDASKFIPYEFKNKDEYKNLKNEIDIINSASKSKIEEFRKMGAEVKDKVMTKTEPLFRRLIEHTLRELFCSVSERLNAVQTHNEWKWVSMLYPASLTRERQIIFLTMDKFLTRNSTIIEPSYLFTSSTLIKDSIIFIDEFDATKDTMLKSIIRTGINDSIDYLTLFKKIHSALNTKEFPAILYRQSLKSKENRKRWTPTKIMESFAEKADNIFVQYSLTFSHKTNSDVEETRNFLFHDRRYHTILQNGNKFIEMRTDNKDQLNYISFVTHKPKNNENNIQAMLGQLEGFIKWFERGVFFLAQNYRELKNELDNQEIKEEFSFESAVQSVLNLFGLEDEYLKFLADHILNDARNQFSSQFNNEATRDSTFYQMGFRYFDFQNDHNDDLQSKVFMTSMQTTPEKLLLLVTDKAKVIGISATASLSTVLGNFDLEYIKQNLGARYYEITEEDRLRLAERFIENQKGYEHNVKIIPEIVRCSIKGQGWQSIYQNPEIAEYASQIVNNSIFNRDNSFAIDRYMRIVYVYRQFKIKNIKSFLCVLTKHPTREQSILCLPILYKLFDLVHQDLGIQRFDSNTICCLDGSDYEENKDNICSRLKSGESLFVISVYQTIGAGQNLQYGIPDGESNLVCINDRIPDKEKDYEAIYLDVPTHLIVNVNTGLSGEDFIKYIYQMEYLNEVGELATDDTIALIKAVFAKHLIPAEDKSIARGRKTMSPYKCVSTLNLGARTIIQAIGRICRTNIKNSNIYIYANELIAPMLSVLDINERCYNLEFKALYDEFAKIGKKSNPIQRNLEWVASHRSETAARNIEAFLHTNSWTEDKIDTWDKLREYVLMHPTIDELELLNCRWKFGYISLAEPSNQYWYKQEDDYKLQLIRFDKPDTSGYVLASSENALLDFVMRRKYFRDVFEKNGYATSFKPNKVVMTPTLYNNIYKGAIGEKIGYEVFDLMGIHLDRIFDISLFEFFDYKIENKPVFVDFKNWKHTTEVDNESQLKLIAAKAKLCKAEGVIIVNMYDESESEPSLFTVEETRILEIPSLLVVNKNNQEPRTSSDATEKIRSFLDEFN